jgi:hypothetical protein
MIEGQIFLNYFIDLSTDCKTYALLSWKRKPQLKISRHIFEANFRSYKFQTVKIACWPLQVTSSQEANRTVASLCLGGVDAIST